MITFYMVPETYKPYAPYAFKIHKNINQYITIIKKFIRI